MKDFGLNPFNRSQAQETNQGLDFKYSIINDWGAFRVSKRADEAYSLKPLVIVNPGDYQNLPHLNQGQVNVDISLVHRDEMNSPVAVDDTKPTEQLFGGETTINKNGIALQLCFAKDTDEIKDHFLSRAEYYDNLDKQEFEEAFAVSNGIEFSDYIKRELSQSMVHDMSDAIGRMINSSANVYHNQNISKHQSGRIIKLAGYTSLIIAGNVAFDLVNSGHKGVDLVTTGVTGIAGSVLMGLEFKNYLTNVPLQQDLISKNAKLLSIQVERDIHHAFCLNYFNEVQNSKLVE